MDDGSNGSNGGSVMMSVVGMCDQLSRITEGMVSATSAYAKQAKTPLAKQKFDETLKGYSDEISVLAEKLIEVIGKNQDKDRPSPGGTLRGTVQPPSTLLRRAQTLSQGKTYLCICLYIEG